jgi:hypothetical protein
MKKSNRIYICLFAGALFLGVFFQGCDILFGTNEKTTYTINYYPNMNDKYKPKNYSDPVQDNIPPGTLVHLHNGYIIDDNGEQIFMQGKDNTVLGGWYLKGDQSKKFALGQEIKVENNMTLLGDWIPTTGDPKDLLGKWETEQALPEGFKEWKIFIANGVSCTRAASGDPVPANRYDIKEGQLVFTENGVEFSIPYELTLTTLTLSITGADGEVIKAEYHRTSQKFTFEVNDDETATIKTYSPDPADGAVVSIPEHLMGLRVSRIGAGAFREKKLTKVNFPSESEIETIDNYAFYGNNIEQIYFPGTLISIGDYAFAGNKLSVVELKEINLTELGKYAFAGNGITEFTLPDTLTSIPEGVFAKNVIGKISIPGVVKEIGAFAFAENKLTSITAADMEGVETIGPGAFWDNRTLESIVFNGKIKNIKGTAAAYRSDPESKEEKKVGAFENCRVKEIVIPETIEELGERAFCQDNLNNASLTKLTFSPRDGNTPSLDIKDEAFSRAFSHGMLTYDLEIPAAVVSIGKRAFEYNQLTGLTFEDGTLDLAIGEEAFQNNNLGINGERLEIPSRVSRIGEGVFRFNKLWSVKWSVHLTEIPASTFSGNRLGGRPEKAPDILEEPFDFPAGLTKIGASAFFGNLIKTVDLSGTQVTGIGASAFFNLPLEKVTLPDAIKKEGGLENQCFAGKSILKEITLGTNLNFDDSTFGDSQKFWTAYKGNSFKGGTYLWENGAWVCP